MGRVRREEYLDLKKLTSLHACAEKSVKERHRPVLSVETDLGMCPANCKSEHRESTDTLARQVKRRQRSNQDTYVVPPALYEQRHE